MRALTTSIVRGPTIFAMACQLTIFYSCILFPSPQNSLINEVYNQRGSKKAVLFIRRGNATVDDSFHLLLTGYDHEFTSSDMGNILVVDSEKNPGIDSSAVSATWISNDSLLVSYQKGLRIFRADSTFEEVKILFEVK
jgi:hypothetical protein